MGRRKIGTAIICCSYFFMEFIHSKKKTSSYYCTLQLQSLYLTIKSYRGLREHCEFYFVENVGEVSHDCGLINGTENDLLVMGR